MSEHSDLTHFLSVESIIDNTLLPDTAVALAHEPPAALVDDLFPPKPLTLSWSDEFHLNYPEPHPHQPTPPALQISPPPWNHNNSLPWPTFHYSFNSQYQDNPPHPAALQINPPPLSVPPLYPHSDINSAPPSTSYSSSPPSSSPFSFPPSPLPPDPAHQNHFDSHSHRYVHPSDLSAPATNHEAPDPGSSPDGPAMARRSPSTLKHNQKSTPRQKRHLPAPATRSRSENPRFRPTRDAHGESSAQALQGEKRKRTKSSAKTRARKRTRSTRLRSDTLARHALQDLDEDHSEDLDADDDDDDKDRSYSTSNSSYSPSPSASPGPPCPDLPNGTSPYTRNGDPEPRVRAPRAPNGPLPLPVPVPNLTKKSRGRKVPSAPDNSGSHAGTSAADEDLNSSNGDATDSRRMRGYMCRVPGCGKCFIRGEHLKRHVRSIHTYEKPHACPHEGCDKTFSRRDNLAQHLRVHR